MAILSDKLILVDADGVLLDWTYSFAWWMNKKGFTVVREDTYDLGEWFGIDTADAMRYVAEFNGSYALRNLPPYKDAMKYVRKLHVDHGYIFHCITAMSEDPDAKKLRTNNLEHLFGSTVFDDVIAVGIGASKEEALEPYRDSGCLWVEDKMENAVLGHEMGLESVIMMQAHNQTFEHDEIKKVYNWKDIYDHVVGV